MKFCWTTMSVSNLEKSLDFYKKIVGLPVSETISTDDGKEIAFLGNEETKVELIESPENHVNEPQGISMGFEVHSLDKQMDFVKQHGIEITAGPIQPVPGIKFFFVNDPDGVSIQFLERN